MEPGLTASVYFATLAAFAASRVRLARGFVHPSVDLKVGPSVVPNAGRGVTTNRDIMKGQQIGTYPGHLRTKKEYLEKIMKYPCAAEYCWQLTTSDWVLDPTDDKGELLEFVQLVEMLGNDVPLLDAFSRPTTLSLINEPPAGGDVNVRVEESVNEAYLLADCPIRAGEELFLDYGPFYDRSNYVRKSE